MGVGRQDIAVRARLRTSEGKLSLDAVLTSLLPVVIGWLIAAASRRYAE